MMRSAVTQAERVELFRVMSPDQAELRAERVALMVVDGGVTAEAAELFCNSEPGLFGFVGKVDQQDSLFG